MSRLSPRHRERVRSVTPLLVAAALVLALLGGWATYTVFLSPATGTETVTVSQWSTDATFEHSAVVRADNEVFPVDSRLDGRSLYYTEVMPVLDGEHRLSYTAAESGTLSTETRATLVVRAVDETDAPGDDGASSEDTAVYWRLTRDLGTTTTDRLAPGERTTIPFSVNVSRLANTTEAAERSLGGSAGRTETVVRVRTTVAGTVDGRQVSEVVVTELPIRVEGSTYRVDAESQRETYRQTEQVETTREYGALWWLGGPLSVLAGLVVAGAVLFGRRSGSFETTAGERARLAHDRSRDEFDEWVTTARLPAEVYDRPRATVDSLEGLVDVAIDTDERVVHDEGRGRYVVTGPEFVYVYDEPPSEH